MADGRERDGVQSDVRLQSWVLTSVLTLGCTPGDPD